jgi:retron-type reverse transcriptase
MAKLVTYHKALPQGAPTSPALANLVCWKLDQELERLAKENSLIYTRYADDLAFSHKDSKYDIHPLIETITKLIEGDEVTNLLVNTKKTRITRPHRRMTVTGVVINDKLSLAKSFRKNLRARIHNIKKSGITISEKESEVIRGHVEWIYSINPQEGQKFRQAFSGISKESQTT